YELVSTNGCIVNGSVEITGPETPVTVELMLTDVLCNGDSTGHAEVSIGGGTPGYEVNWWGENPDALFAGEYTVQVMDFNLCEVNLDFSITEPPVLDVELFTSDVHCSGEPSGQASVSISGGSPGYETNWYGENPDSLLAGNYSVEIIDSHLCTSELYFTIEQPDPMVLQLTTTDEYENTEMGTATLVLEGGVPPYSIEWSTGATNELSQNSLPAGTYFVSVTDDNGCVQTIEFEIGFVSGISSQQLMTEFSLYPVPFHSELTLRNPGRAEVEVNVTDAIGKIVFQIRGSSDYEIPLLLGSGSSGLYTVKVRSNAGVCYYHVTRQ
ncbi:MAG: T9SS type A sorting domain-containing protein, partial [Nitrospirota bacterium]|nr:T9SS type A sorting domain-containing protein [Nitrospirota bacterium]